MASTKRRYNNGNPKKPGQRPEKADDSAVEEYGRRYWAWQASASKVLAAQDLIELAGGYDEAFVLLDAIMYSPMDATVETRRSAAEQNGQPEREYVEKMKQWEVTARQVLAARKLFSLAAEEAFLVLDAVLIATQGEQAHLQAKEAHGVSAKHHDCLAVEENEKA